MATRSILLAVADPQLVVDINQALGPGWEATSVASEADALAHLAKQSFDGRSFTFSSTSTTGAVLTMNLQMGNEGKLLRGNGKHNGFGTRMELQRAN